MQADARLLTPEMLTEHTQDVSGAAGGGIWDTGPAAGQGPPRAGAVVGRALLGGGAARRCRQCTNGRSGRTIS